jgi:hypothetical protein
MSRAFFSKLHETHALLVEGPRRTHNLLSTKSTESDPAFSYPNLQWYRH